MDWLDVGPFSKAKHVSPCTPLFCARSERVASARRVSDRCKSGSGNSGENSVT